MIGSLPFADTVDTTTATTTATTDSTTDGDDADMNATCGAPVMDASVWYEITATTDGGLIADVSGSGYGAGVLVATGGPGAWTPVTSGPGIVAWPTSAGQTYAVLPIAYQGTAAATVARCGSA